MQLLKATRNSKRTMKNARAQRRGYACARLPMALGLTCLLLAASGVVLAQQADAGVAGQSAGGAEARGELPRVLFLLQRPAGTIARHDDPTTQLSATLREALGASNRYNIILYSPEQPSVKRALLEHTLPVSDLVEPIRPDALQRVARAIGARYAMTLKPTFDKDGIKVNLRYDEDLNGETWRNTLSEEITFDAVVGKRHLKPTDLIALAVDGICARLGVKSHLAAKIDGGPIKTSQSASNLKPTKKMTQEQVLKSAGVTVLNTQDGKHDSATAPTATKSDTNTTAQTSGSQQDNPLTSPPIKSANGDGAATPDTNATETPAVSPQPVKKAVTTKQPIKNAQAVHNNQLGAVVPPPAVPPPAPVHPDYVMQAQRDKQAGDISSEITMLRRAVTASPHDATLRRQLIQAYEDRHMSDAALSEVERALQLMPADSNLKRLHGDALLAKGDTPGALKIYREIVQGDPADIAAQVALADALLADNQYTEALSAYETAAKNDPNSPLPHRRLARVYAGRAAADPAQYRLSLNQLELARQLTPTSDTETYRQDYIALMQQMEQRLRDVADELQNSYQATVQGRTTITDVTRSMADLKERTNALGDFLDQVTPAAGQDGPHKHYALGAALLVQAIDTFRKVLAGTNTRIEDAQGPLRAARADTLHELNTANKMLTAAPTEQHTGSSNSVTIGGTRLPSAP